METFEIYTIGSGYYLEKIFNAIRLILDPSNNFTSVMKLSTLAAVAVMTIRAGLNGDFKSAAKWFFGVTILVGLFLTSKANVEIIDTLPDSYGRLSATRRVDSVPWGLALIGSVTSNIGNNIAQKFDQSLSGVFNNPDYQKTGILFGSKIVEDTSKMHIDDPALKQLMHKFYKKCIVPDLNMGYKRVNGYSLKDLTESRNILEFLKDHSSKARIISVGNLANNINGANTNGYLSCQKTAEYLYTSLDTSITKRMPVLAQKFSAFFGFHGPAESSNSASEMFKSVLESSYGIFIRNSSKEAKDILLQNIAINSLGEAASSLAYGKVATESMTKLAYNSVGQMAQKFIPILRAVLECLFYGVFPLVLILMVTPIGLDVLKNYAFGFIYLQLWQPMYAILFCIASSWGKLYSSNITDITFATHSQIAMINEEISAVSGYMLTLVPVLSLFITKGMVANMGNLANSILYIPQSTAVQNADSAVRGNYQIGTTSIDTHQANTLTANKFDDNYSWISGMKSFSMPSGAQEKMFSDGRSAIDSSGAVSNTAGLIDIDWNKSIGSRFDQSINDNLSRAEHHASRSLESATAGYSTLLGFDKNFAQGSSAYNDWRKGLTSEQRSSLDEARSYVDRYAETHGVSQQDALKITVAANGGFKSKQDDFIPAISAYLGLDVSTDASMHKAYNNSLEAIKNASLTEALQNVKNISKANSLQDSYSSNNSMLYSVRSNFDQSRSASLEANKSFDKAHTLQEAKSSYENNSANINQKLNNLFAERQIEALGASGFDNMLRNNPRQTRTNANQFIDQMFLGEIRGIKEEFSEQKMSFNQFANTSVDDEYSKEKKLLQDKHQSNKEQVIKVIPENFENNIANKIDGTVKHSVNEDIEEDNNYLIEKADSLHNNQAKFQNKVSNKSRQGATKTLIDAWNPFHKDEN